MHWLLCCALCFLPGLPLRADEKQSKPNTLTPKEIAEGWILLFDGESTFGWKTEGDVEARDGTLKIGGNQQARIVLASNFNCLDLQFEARWAGRQMPAMFVSGVAPDFDKDPAVGWPLHKQTTLKR